MVHFCFTLHFYNVRIVANTFANVGWREARHSICVITQSPLNLPLVFAHSVCYYSVNSHCYQRGVTLLTGHKQVYLFCAMKFLCIFIALWYLILTVNLALELESL